MTARLVIKNGNYYGVINYKVGDKYKTKWVALGMPAKNNKRKAEAKLEEVKAEFEEQTKDMLVPGTVNVLLVPSDMLFVDYLKGWLATKKNLIALSTWEGYKIYTEKHVIPYFDPLHLKLSEIKPSHIKAYYEYKYANGRLDGKEGGLSIVSIRQHAICIKEALDDAVLSEIIMRNPASGVKMPAKHVSFRQKTFLTADKANELLRAFNGHPLQALIYVTLYYGLRRSESLGLRWSAVDFDKNTLTINHTVVKNVTIVEKDTVKTQSSYHTYTLIDDVKKVLLEKYKQRQENRALYGSEYKESDYIFTWDDGTLFRPDYVTKAFQKVLKRSGIPPMRFHDLRHSTASILYDKGWSLKDIQSWLRHSNIGVTSDIYTHITEDRKSKLADELNNTFDMTN